MFDEHDWVIRRPMADPEEVDAVAGLLAAAQKPLIIAGGGVIYSGGSSELDELATAARIPVAETFAGKGALQQRGWWQLGGIGLGGTPATTAPAPAGRLVLSGGPP